MNIKSHPCPVCNIEMDADGDFMGYTLLESTHRCTKGCKRYGEEFITGAYETFIKMDDGEWKTWQWSYASPKEETEQIDNEIAIVISQIQNHVCPQ